MKVDLVICSTEKIGQLSVSPSRQAAHIVWQTRQLDADAGSDTISYCYN